MSVHARPGDAGRGRAIRLTDRVGERDVLDRLIEAVRAGESRALVVRGDPGMGKTVLLDYLAGRASGAGCHTQWACSRRWNWRSRGCISWARRC